jgi:sugar phosphate permease
MCTLGNFVMGMSSQILITVSLFVLSNAIHKVAVAPNSIWIGNEVKSDLGTAFSLAKVSSSLLGFFITMLFAIVQPYLGIDLSLIIFGIVGLVMSFSLWLFLS